MTAAARTHTPGPWGYEDPMGPDILTIVANPDAPTYEWVFVAQIGTDGVDDDKRSFVEHEANARLIAAAPDLLTALRNFTDGDTITFTEALEIAEAAIAKATGAA